MLETDEYSGNTPSRYSRRSVGTLTTRFRQPGGAVSFSYPQSCDEYQQFSGWPSYHGYSLPEYNMQLQETLDRIMGAQLEMKNLIDKLSSHVTELEQLLSSKSSTCSSSTETETKSPTSAFCK